MLIFCLANARIPVTYRGRGCAPLTNWKLVIKVTVTSDRAISGVLAADCTFVTDSSCDRIIGRGNYSRWFRLAVRVRPCSKLASPTLLHARRKRSFDRSNSIINEILRGSNEISSPSIGEPRLPLASLRHNGEIRREQENRCIVYLTC